MVRDKRLALTRPVSNPLRPEYDHRCLYRSLRYLSLCPPVSCSFEGGDDARLQQMTFSSKPGFASSPHRMCMFGITTFIFTLGIIALVLEITLELMTANPSTLVDTLENNCYYAWATVTCLMVRLRDTFISDSINTCSVYSMRYNLRLAHG
jgi:hypothetical protein